jgi:hypothetical protein
MAECYRVLKPGRWLCLCYHDASEQRWTIVQNLMAEAGFVADASARAGVIDTGQKSFNQFMADKATKRDLVVNFRKPRPGEVRPAAEPAAFEPLARRVIVEYLTEHPGATKDRVYDALIGRLVGRGQLQPHDFDALLRSVAQEERAVDAVGPEGAGRWTAKDPSKNNLYN